MSTKGQYFRNVLAQGLGRILTLCVSFLVFVLIARRMGVDLFGQYTYIVTFLALFVVASEFGTQSILAKDIAQVKNKNVYWGNYLLIRISFTLIACATALIVALFLRKDLHLYLTLGVLAIPFLNSRYFEPIYQVFHKPWYSTIASVSYAVSFLTFSGLVLLLRPKLSWMIGAYLAANAIYTLIAYTLAFKLLKPTFKFDKPMIKSIVFLTLPVGVSSIFTIINSKIDIFMLAQMKSDQAVGIYNAAYRFLDIVLMLAGMMMIPLIPIFSRWAVEDKATLRRNYMRIIETIIVALVPLAIIVPLFSKPLILTVFGDEFLEAAKVLNILCWVGILVFISLINSASNLSVGEVNHAYWNTALAATMNITMNYFWIPRYSFIGSTWATLISEISLMSVSLYYVIYTLGNVFVLHRWIKIVSLIACFAALIHLPFAGAYKLISCLTGILIYVAAVYHYQLINVDFLFQYLRAKGILSKT